MNFLLVRRNVNWPERMRQTVTITYFAQNRQRKSTLCCTLQQHVDCNCSAITICMNVSLWLWLHDVPTDYHKVFRLSGAYVNLLVYIYIFNRWTRSVYTTELFFYRTEFYDFMLKWKVLTVARSRLLFPSEIFHFHAVLYIFFSEWSR